jgi:Uma2 family endonuclease
MRWRWVSWPGCARPWTGFSCIVVVMAAPIPGKFTAEEYLARERLAAHKSEYWHGHIYAMAGGTENHELIGSNLSYFLQHRLRSTACRVFTGNMKVGVTKRSGFSYPDLTITCGERKFYDAVRDVLVNPTVIFEVLSDSTREFDQTKKWHEYQKLESLQHYVLVEQQARLVRQYSRTDAGDWLFQTLEAANAVLKLSAIGVELPLDEIYWEIAFPPPDEDES